MISDPAGLSIKKCTCVNNRCIRSKISGDNLDCGRVELSADVKLTEAGRCQTIIEPGATGSSSELEIRVWSQWLQFEVVRTRPNRELGSQGYWLRSPAGWERSALISRRAGGQYVAVFVQSPTHLSHITLSYHFQ